MKILHSVSLDFGTGILTISGLKQAYNYSEVGSGTDARAHIVTFADAMEASVDFDGHLPVDAVILFADKISEAALEHIMDNFNELEELADCDDTFAFGDALVCFNPVPHGKREVIFDEAPITKTGESGMSFEDFLAMNTVKTSLFGATPLSHLTSDQKEQGQRDLAFLKTLLNMGK